MVFSPIPMLSVANVLASDKSSNADAPPPAASHATALPVEVRTCPSEPTEPAILRIAAGKLTEPSLAPVIQTFCDITLT